MTTKEEIRLTLAGIDARINESLRSRHREFELGCEGLTAVARHRYPTAASLEYVNYGDGDSRDDYHAAVIRDAEGTALWVSQDISELHGEGPGRHAFVDWNRRMPYAEWDKFTVLIQTYADHLKHGTKDDLCLDWSGDGFPVLTFPAL